MIKLFRDKERRVYNLLLILKKKRNVIFTFRNLKVIRKTSTMSNYKKTKMILGFSLVSFFFIHLIIIENGERKMKTKRSYVLD